MKKNNLTENDLDKLLEQLSKSAHAPSSQFSAEKGYIKLGNKIFAKRTKRLSFIKYVAAASIALIISFSTYLSINAQSETIMVATTDYTKEIILPDGSSVILNHYSSLQYPSKFEKNSRKVEIKGEAYFDISKDKERPFIVSAEDLRIQVLGTQFNVESYPKEDYIKTTLIEGSVSVNYKPNKDAVILSPNESALFNKSTERLHKESNERAKDEILWKEGKLIFNNITMGQIATDLSNHFNISTIVSDSTLQEYKVTARFEQNESLDDILNILQGAINFKWIKSDSAITITPDN